MVCHLSEVHVICPTIDSVPNHSPSIMSHIILSCKVGIDSSSSPFSSGSVFVRISDMTWLAADASSDVSINSVLMSSFESRLTSSGIDWKQACSLSRTCSRCLRKRSAVSSRCRFCTSIITRSVSRAWCGRNSLMRWWIWMKRRVRSSIFSVRFAESGSLINMSRRSRKLMTIEWLSFLSSRRWS